MKKIPSLLFFACTIIILVSCQKEISGELPGTDPTTNAYKIKTYSETVTSATAGNSSTTFDVSYNANDKITSLVTEGSVGDKFVFNYPSATKMTIDIYNSGVVSIHEDVFINNLAFVDSTFQYNDTNDSMTEKYIYTAGKLTRYKEFNYSQQYGPQLYNSTDYTYDGTGNLVKTVDTNGEIFQYEYSTELNTIVLDNYTLKNKYLIKKTTYFDGSETTTVNHSYTFDNMHRIISEKDEISTGDVVVKSYTYF